jgi:hypothetical protein
MLNCYSVNFLTLLKKNWTVQVSLEFPNQCYFDFAELVVTPLAIIV